MTIQYELDFTTDHLTDLLFDLRYMAHRFTTAPHPEKISNELAFNNLISQLQDLKGYAFKSNIIDWPYAQSITDSIIFSIHLYWGV